MKLFKVTAVKNVSTSELPHVIICFFEDSRSCWESSFEVTVNFLSLRFISKLNCSKCSLNLNAQVEQVMDFIMWLGLNHFYSSKNQLGKLIEIQKLGIILRAINKIWSLLTEIELLEALSFWSFNEMVSGWWERCGSKT